MRAKTAEPQGRKVRTETRITEEVQPEPIPPEEVPWWNKTATHSAPAGFVGDKPLLWDFIRSTDKDDWERYNIVAYLYRTDPASSAGKRIFLEKRNEPFTLADIEEKWGGNDLPHGVHDRFAVWLNAQEIPPRVLYNIDFQIAGPPKVPEGKAPGTAPAANNETMNQLLLDRLIKVMDDRLAAITQHGQDPNQALAQAMQAVAQINDSATKMFIERLPKPTDPMDRLNEIKTMLEFLKPVLSPAVAANPAVPAVPVKSTLEQLKEFLELQDLLDKQRNKGGEEKLSAADIAKAVVTAVKESGLARRGGGTDWIQLAQPLLPTLAKLGEAAAAWTVARFGVGPQQPQPGQAIVGTREGTGNRGQGRAPGDVVPIRPNGSEAGVARPAAAAPGASPFRPGQGLTGQAIPPDQLARPEEVNREQATGNREEGTGNATGNSGQGTGGSQGITPDMIGPIYWNLMTGKIVEWVLADKPGDEMAATAYNMFGNLFPQLFVNLRKMTMAELTALFQGPSDRPVEQGGSDPVLATVKDDPRLASFLEDFLGWFQPDVEPGEDGDGEPAA